MGEDGGMTDNGRRTVLAGLGLGAIGVATGRSEALQARPAGPAGGETGRGEIARWSRRVGDSFRVAGAGGALRLVSVEPTKSAGPRPKGVSRRRNFIALFEAAGPDAPQGDATYLVSHPALGAFPLYLGAKAKVSGTLRFVAAFN